MEWGDDHSAGTFEYEAEFTKDSFSDSDVVVNGKDLRRAVCGRNKP